MESVRSSAVAYIGGCGKKTPITLSQKISVIPRVHTSRDFFTSKGDIKMKYLCHILSYPSVSDRTLRGKIENAHLIDFFLLPITFYGVHMMPEHASAIF